MGRIRRVDRSKKRRRKGGREVWTNVGEREETASDERVDLNGHPRVREGSE